MKLGNVPVLETGALKLLDMRLDPVPAGRVLVLFGPLGPIELAAGNRTNIDLRRRYPSYAVVDISPSDIEFSHEYHTDDRAFGYRITVNATVQVGRAAEFVEKNGAQAEIGAPFVDHWKMVISKLVNEHGRGGLAGLQKYVAKMQADMSGSIAERPPTYRGVQLLSCSFATRELSLSVIGRELRDRGVGVASELKLRYPHRVAEINDWVDRHRSDRQRERDSHYDDHERNAALFERNLGLQERFLDAELRAIEAQIRLGIIDPDEAAAKLTRNFTTPDGTRGLLQGEGEPAAQKQIKGTAPVDDDLED